MPYDHINLSSVELLIAHFAYTPSGVASKETVSEGFSRRERHVYNPPHGSVCIITGMIKEVFSKIDKCTMF